MAKANQRCRFLDDLPAELRLQIYHYHFQHLLEASIQQLKTTNTFTKPTSPILSTSKFIRGEARTLYLPQLHALFLITLRGKLRNMHNTLEAVSKVRAGDWATPSKEYHEEIQRFEEASRMWGDRRGKIETAMREERERLSVEGYRTGHVEEWVESVVEKTQAATARSGRGRL